MLNNFLQGSVYLVFISSFLSFSNSVPSSVQRLPSLEQFTSYHSEENLSGDPKQRLCPSLATECHSHHLRPFLGGQGSMKGKACRVRCPAYTKTHHITLNWVLRMIRPKQAFHREEASKVNDPNQWNTNQFHWGWFLNEILPTTQAKRKQKSHNSVRKQAIRKSNWPWGE